MQLKSILEGALLAAGRPLTLEQLGGLFDEGSRPDAEEIRAALDELAADCSERGIELTEVSTGHRLQVRRELAPWIARLSEDKPPRYSRALLETLAIIAYRQPITRADIEEVRGVAVNPAIIRTLQEREWVRVVGHRDVPGRPELLATTRQFLDHFGLKSLEDLPPLSEIKDFEQLNPEVPLAMGEPEAPDAIAPVVDADSVPVDSLNDVVAMTLMAADQDETAVFAPAGGAVLRMSAALAEAIDDFPETDDELPDALTVDEIMNEGLDEVDVAGREGDSDPATGQPAA
jgi:segregation and condensation protein B